MFFFVVHSFYTVGLDVSMLVICVSVVSLFKHLVTGC